MPGGISRQLNETCSVPSASLYQRISPKPGYCAIQSTVDPDMAPPGMNAAAMSAYRMLSDLGYVVGPIALGLLTDLLGPDTALAAAAALLVAVALLFARFAPETHRGVRF